MAPPPLGCGRPTALLTHVSGGGGEALTAAASPRPCNEVLVADSPRRWGSPLEGTLEPAELSRFACLRARA
jgi:hypothetical protein